MLPRKEVGMDKKAEVVEIFGYDPSPAGLISLIDE
jgi:hypothetical protein